MVVGGEARAVQGLRRKAVLAILGLHAGEVVSTGRLVELVWDGAAPPNAVNALQSHLSYLRRTLSDKAAVRSRPPGYVLDVGPDGTDVAIAERLIGAGLRDGDDAVRARDLQRALDLWRGQPMADATGVTWLEEQAERLGQLWLQGKRALLAARLGLGHHAQLLPELEQLTREHPFDEQLHGQLMLALYRMGRQADALSTFQRLRRTLRDDLGIEPGPALRELESAMLRQAEHLDAPRAAATVTVAAEDSAREVAPQAVPAQIPLAVRTFAGRDGQLARLDALLPAQWTPPGSAVFVAVVSGTAGVGKSALAVHWAHRVADRFPDGQLYVNLRGFDPSDTPMPPADAVRGFLDALGVPAERVPADLAGLSALLRSQLAGRRVLILLDNARDAEQVRPLLPAAPGCLVVVTSRDSLTSLVAIEGAVPVPVDLLTDGEARDLLVSRLGARRVAAEPEAVERIATRCARLPIALAVVAGRAATRPDLPLSAFAEELGRFRTTLDAVAGADPASDVRAVFSWSYRALSPAAAAVLRRMSLGPGPDLGIGAVASLAGVPVPQARTSLAELDRAGLVVEQRPGRYTFHDLLRAYATELVETADAEDGRAAAVNRLLEHYVATAQAAAQRLDPARDPVPRAARHPAIAVPAPPREEAQAWFDDECRSLLAAVRLAAELGLDEHTWRLAAAMTTFLDWHGQWQELVATQEAALRALRRLGDRPGQGAASCELGQVYARIGRFDEAHQYLWTALSLFEQLDDAPGLARAHYQLGWLQHAQRRYRDALSHSEQALALFERLGDKLWRARALNATGWILGQLGEYQQALRLCRDALVENREVGDRHGEAGTWDAVGYAHHRLGDPRQAVACFGHALRAYRELGDRSGQACVLCHLGDAYADLGDASAAADAWRRSVEILDEFDPAQAAVVRAKLPGEWTATVRG
ncbi:AfsR/SARP family transcriptional regulator [Dactylosporangium matsuzakiense]|uniref:SARP family transcriptional regulator n=1 Tax=Dactylosporangium matsuzakiense TaxID=53360 RepID=A0A9W6KMJ2_9ACTN|nr:BTAD domain-containing putative transcriptional regulator [Dactylosporangium matsuzakiense]UWZ42970.1 tetratricopeptide repeat protein [Dactylosporangium matsuzakiense]GLL03289.1 SARP family transcriptional regulator [Dactylosporangium matsuzakiense]